jgi:hypothetical protein
VGSRVTARVLLECNNRCVFCGQAGLQGGAPFEEQLEAARREGNDVTIVGGEPTLDPRLAERIAAARRMGFVRVGLQTNGRRLAEPGFAAELARAGLTDVHLSIHGAESAVHDYHTGIPGSFTEALSGLAAARASGLTVVVVTVLTRSSFRSLAGLPKLLSQRGAAAWLVSIPVSAGRLSAEFDRLMPRLGLAVPFALSALAAGEALGLDVWISGAPRCLLGAYARWALDAPQRAFAEVCAGCPARASCPGLDPAYLERFGGDELGPARARMEAAPTEAPGHDSPYARLFVGVGELGPPATRPPTPNADKGYKGRVALPMAGKVRPAVAEATAGSPRRSGEALREIFPELFEGAPKPPSE